MLSSRTRRRRAIRVRRRRRTNARPPPARRLRPAGPSCSGKTGRNAPGMTQDLPDRPAAPTASVSVRENRETQKGAARALSRESRAGTGPFGVTIPSCRKYGRSGRGRTPASFSPPRCHWRRRVSPDLRSCCRAAGLRSARRSGPASLWTAESCCSLARDVCGTLPSAARRARSTAEGSRRSETAPTDSGPPPTTPDRCYLAGSTMIRPRPRLSR